MAYLCLKLHSKLFSYNLCVHLICKDISLSTGSTYITSTTQLTEVLCLPLYIADGEAECKTIHEIVDEIYTFIGVGTEFLN